MFASKIVFKNLIFISSLFIFSCTKTVDVVGPQGSQGPQGSNGNSAAAPVGDMQGRIQLYDEQGNLLNDNSGTLITLEQTSPLLQATSTIDGSFTLQSVHAGNYNLRIEKAGYGTMRFLNVENAGGSPATKLGLLKTGQQLTSQYDIKNLIVDTAVSPNNGLSITIILAHPQKITNPVLLYFNDSSNVNANNNEYIFRSLFYQQDDTTLTYSVFDNLLSIYSDKLASASYLYMTASFDNVEPLSYINETGMQIIPCEGNLSNVAKVRNVLK